MTARLASKKCALMRDFDPAIIRAQCAADPVKIAREIVRAKIAAELKATIRDAEAEANRLGALRRRGEYSDAVIRLARAHDYEI